MAETSAPKCTVPRKNKITHTFRKPLISGLLIVVPMGVTAFVLKLLYAFTAGRLSPFVRKYIDPVPDYTSPVIASILLFAFIYFMGLIASVVVGKKLIALFENLIQTIPFVKSIYKASKQVVESLTFAQEDTAFKIPVLIEFPCPGMKCIGLALGTIRCRDGREYYNVFVPTTSNITVGLYLLVAPEDVYKCDLTIDEAVKIIVSGGILGPEQMDLTSAAITPLGAPMEEEEDDDEE
ncbi:MAG TPA: DUF502 domain-containing protein [Candidatus Hydrogenedentes bacterium]|nr:DUF502 domain-containing protein [Candidatus Hydrogenedentota bacterium]